MIFYGFTSPGCIDWLLVARPSSRMAAGCRKPIVSIRVCLLVFQSKHDVLVERKIEQQARGGQRVVLCFTAEEEVPTSCPDIQQFAMDITQGLGVPIAGDPTLATVFEDDVDSGRFSFIYFVDQNTRASLQETTSPGEMGTVNSSKRSRPARKGLSSEDGCTELVQSVNAGEEGARENWRTIIAYPTAVLDGIKKGVTEEGEDGDVELCPMLDRVVGTFRPLREELGRVGKNSVRAYPMGTAIVQKYARADLEDYHLLDPVQYTFDTQGKGVRSQSIAVLAKHFKIAKQDLESMLFCIERFHEASLVIDDIEDASELRRDEKCAYLEFGIPLTLNAAYLCVFKMLNDVPQLFRGHHDRSRQLLLEGFVSAHRGQGLDIYWREHSYCPTEEEYIDMIRGKTSTPFVMAASLFFLHSEDWRLQLARLGEMVLRVLVALFSLVGLLWLIMALLRPVLSPGFFDMTAAKKSRKARDTSFEADSWRLDPASVTKALPSNTERSIAHLFDQIGVFFQIRDDYINLTSEKYWEKKGFCDDIHEKKYSFPIIRMIRSKAGRYRDLVALFESEEELSMEQLRAGLSWIEATDALRYTREFLFRLRDDIVHTISNSGLPELDTLIMQRLTID